MTKPYKYIIVLFFLCFGIYAQNKKDSLYLNFNLKFNSRPFQLNKEYISQNNDTIVVTNFKCYISNIEIIYSDKKIYKKKNSYHLLDFEQPNSMLIPISKKKNKNISKVIFNIGIDSTTNCSGAMAGDLDPTKGMYWAWQSGYINYKIEGNSSSCNTRKNQFQFHIGGYQNPNNALRTITLYPNKRDSDIRICMDLGKFLNQIDLRKVNSVMIPGKQAMEMADFTSEIFSLE